MTKTIAQFNGFNNNLLSKTEKDFVKIPLQAFDLLYNCQGEAETKTLLAILQKLRQFGKSWDWINNENLLQITGLSRNSITKAIISLTKKNIILIRKLSGRRVIFLNTELAKKICQMIDENLIKFTDLIRDKLKGFSKLFNKLREYFLQKKDIKKENKDLKNFENTIQTLADNAQVLTSDAQSLGTHNNIYIDNNIHSNNNNNTIDYAGNNKPNLSTKQSQKNIKDLGTLPEPGKNNLKVSGSGSAASLKINDMNNLEKQITDIKTLCNEIKITLPDNEIRNLLKNYSQAAIIEQITYLPYRTYNNPIAMLKAALSKGYTKPAKYQAEETKQSENKTRFDYMTFLDCLGFNPNINGQENDILKYILENISLNFASGNENSFCYETDFIQKTRMALAKISEKSFYDILYGLIHVGAINPFFRHIDFKELVKTSGKEKTTEIIFNILKTV